MANDDTHNNPTCSCEHTRRQHSKDGCTNCSCKVTYMDLKPSK